MKLLWHSEILKAALLKTKQCIRSRAEVSDIHINGSKLHEISVKHSNTNVIGLKLHEPAWNSQMIGHLKIGLDTL